MTYSLNSREIIENINPVSVVQALKDRGWKVFPRKNEDVKIMQYEKNDEFYQIQIPMDKELYDYHEAMYESIETVSKAERESFEKVIIYLLHHQYIYNLELHSFAQV